MTEPCAAPVGGVATSRSVAVVLLFLVSLLNYLDRYVLSVLLPAIKSDLALSDTQLGVLTGVAFTLLYATMGIPIGRLADRRSRKAVIVASVAFWSVATAMCGMARSFLQLALARVAVGVGEAGVTPAALSLMTDLFSPQQRATAVSLYTLGSPIGIFFGFLVGGLLGELYGWRVALLTLSVPGLALAATIVFLLPDPRRKAATVSVTGQDAPLSIAATLRLILSSPSYRHVTLGAGFFTVGWVGLLSWLPSFYSRSHGLGPGEVGTNLAVVLGISQAIGVIAGGLLSDRMSRADRRWHFRTMLLATLAPMPFYPLMLLWPTPGVSFAFVFVAFLLAAFQGGPQLAIVQSVVRAQDRGVAVAVNLAGVNIIAGAGTMLIGVVSDVLTPLLGQDALAVSILACVLGFSVLAGLHYWLGTRHIRAEWIDEALESVSRS